MKWKGEKGRTPPPPLQKTSFLQVQRTAVSLTRCVVRSGRPFGASSATTASGGSGPAAREGGVSIVFSLRGMYFEAWPYQVVKLSNLPCQRVFFCEARSKDRRITGFYCNFFRPPHASRNEKRAALTHSKYSIGICSTVVCKGFLILSRHIS